MYIIEGNIGAGKSTLADILRSHLYQTYIVSEPVHAWHDQHAHNSLLGHFLYDPCRWGFTMETYAMMSRVKDHMHYQQYETPVVLERSIYSGHYCFACNGFKQGFMTLKEWDIYMQYFNYLIPRHCNPPTGFIFLDVSPDVAFDRIQERNRNQEASIPYDYLEQLDEMHRSFLLHKEHVLPDIKNTPVLQISADHEFANNEQRQHEMIQSIRDFMMQYG